METRTLYTSVSSVPGFGDSGQKLELVPETCEFCSHDRILRHTNVSPEFSDETEEKCLLPNCPKYHDGEWDHFFGHRPF